MVRGDIVAIDIFAGLVDSRTPPLEICVEIDRIAPIGANRIGDARDALPRALRTLSISAINAYLQVQHEKLLARTRVYVMLSAVTRAQKRAAAARLEDDNSRMIKKALRELLSLRTGNRSQRTRRLSRPLPPMRSGASRLPQLWVLRRRLQQPMPRNASRARRRQGAPEFLRFLPPRATRRKTRPRRLAHAGARAKLDRSSRKNDREF